MKRIGLLFLSAITVSGCQRDDSKLKNEIADLKTGQAEILDAIKKIPASGRAQPQRPQRPRPKPEAVYSVNIKGAPYKGVKDAKVTVVEAFEFA